MPAAACLPWAPQKLQKQGSGSNDVTRFASMLAGSAVATRFYRICGSCMPGMHLIVLCGTHQGHHAATSAEHQQTDNACKLCCTHIRGVDLWGLCMGCHWARWWQSVAASSTATEVPVRVARDAFVRKSAKNADTHINSCVTRSEARNFQKRQFYWKPQLF